MSTRRAVQLDAQHHRGARHDDRHGGRRRASTSEDAFYMAVALLAPGRRRGAHPVPQTTLLTAHRAAWQLAKLDERSEVKAILIEPDAVRRIALTLSSSLTGGEAGRIVVDAFSSLPRLARLATAAVLAPLAGAAHRPAGRHD